MSATEDVYLNIYDYSLKILNSHILPRIGIGIHHSGVQVYNKEYSFCGHYLHISGIIENEPRNCVPMDMIGFKFRQSLRLGVTGLSSTEVREIIKDMGNEYKGDTYHLMTRNCHNFSNALLNLLCDISLPLWVNRLARVFWPVSFLMLPICCTKQFGIVITPEQKQFRERFDELKKTAREKHGKHELLIHSYLLDKMVDNEMRVSYNTFTNTIIFEELKK